jgi:hypothetical protein
MFGTAPVRFTVADSVDPKITRSFESPAKMAEEQRLVRIWGGIHFRTSLTTSDDMGRKLATYLIANSIKPPL